MERISHEAQYEEHHDDEEKHGLLTSDSSKLSDRVSRLITSVALSRLMRYASLPYKFIDRTILLLGFIAVASGIVTYGGHFVSLRPKACSRSGS